MGGESVGRRPSRPLLTFGRVHLLRVQVGYRTDPESQAYEQFLLDLPVPDPADGAQPVDLDEQRVLTALEPAVHVDGVPRHYSLNQHRWHTSWGLSPGALEIGLLVTTGTRTEAVSRASREAVCRSFRDLLEAGGAPEPTPTSRDAAVSRARRGTATLFGLDPEALSLSAEQHHPAANSWALRLRAASGDEYDALVGLVDGYAGSLRVRHEWPTEVFDAVGTE